MLQGSCLCGGVRYEIREPLGEVVHCHCSMCRKAHGAAFRTRASVSAEAFDFITGEHLVTYYESSPGEHRSFCSVCGSNLITKLDRQPEVYGFPLGTLDSDPHVTPTRHVFTRYKAPWFTITDDLPRSEEGAPGSLDERDPILECEADLRQAQLTSDVAALDRLLDDALVFTTVEGAIVGKADDLSMHRSGRFRITRMDPSDRRIIRFGSTAVVSVRMEAAASLDGAALDATLRYTRVWRQRPDGWRLIAGHMSVVQA
jgi:ketosteroid isomerase-like protein